MSLPVYASPIERIAYCGLLIFCTLLFVFLIAPVLVVIPLSFNTEPYFSYPMPGLSMRWYENVIYSEEWQRALRNSVFVGVCSMTLATVLGTFAALGLTRSHFPLKSLVMAIVISPMAVPVVIAAVGLYFFFAQLGLTSTLTGIVIAHTVLGVPFVVITVSATLTGLDRNLLRAGIGLGASPLRVFLTITLPLILPGVVAGAIFAFITSWDDVVVVLFLAGVEESTLPRRMWAGVREIIDPSILAVATLLTIFSIALLTVLEALRRRNARLRGLKN